MTTATNEQREALLPLPEPDERTRTGLAFSGFAMEAYARANMARAREADLEAMQETLKALNGYMHAIRFSQDKHALMAAILSADDQAAAAIKALEQRVGES